MCLTYYRLEDGILVPLTADEGGELALSQLYIVEEIEYYDW